MESLRIKKDHFKNETVDEEEKKGSDDSYEMIDSMDEDVRSVEPLEDNSDDDQGQKKERKLNKLKSFKGLDEGGFEHLSQYDPDDQFLKSDRSLSVIDSILSMAGGTRDNRSESSEFSIISAGNIKSVLSASIISKADNLAMQQISFIERREEDNYLLDVVAQKIIYYLSLWSDDMRDQLTKLQQKGQMAEVSKGNK